jgi:hypothetical protein
VVAGFAGEGEQIDGFLVATGLHAVAVFVRHGLILAVCQRLRIPRGKMPD